MKKQIVFVNWWEAKENYKDFIDYLNQIEYKPFSDKKKWRYTFKEDLWEDFEVFDFAMPNKDFADYNEWKIMFEKCFEYLRDDVILLWHSLWWSFLTKYLNENTFPVKIKHIVFLASAFKDSQFEVLWTFNFDKKLTNLKKFEEKITFFHSRDDLVVPFDDLEDYKKLFPKSKYMIFEDKFHFIEHEFPELIDYIKSIK